MSDSTLAIDGLSVAITGAAQGIGRHLAERLARAGARLVVSDLDAQACARAVDDLRAQGAAAQGVVGDVRDAGTAQRIVDAASPAHGRLDVMICNAGIVQVRPFMDLAAEDWDSVLSVNVRGAFLCLQAAARRMREQAPPAPGRPRGKVLTMASIAARYGGGPMAPYLAPYRASKAAVLSLTRSAAIALAPDVAVNAICPGLVATDMWKRMDRSLAEIENGREGEAFARRVAAVPLGRAQTPGDVAGVALFPASPAADYMTGQSINVDGGLVLN